MSARRGHHEGTIYERRNGKHQAQISLPDGTRKTFTADTKREVQRMLQQARMDAVAGKLMSNNPRTVADYLSWWLQTIEPSVRYSTFRCYELNARRLSTYFGDTRLDELRAPQIQQTYAELLKTGLSPRSVELAHVVLHAALRHATRLGIIGHNPSDAVIPPRGQRHEARTLSPKEAQQLFDAAPNETLRTLFITMCTTGVRVGEALGLRWSDIDLTVGTIAVRRAIQRQRDKGVVYIEPKTRMSRRTILLTDFAREALIRHRAGQTAYYDNTPWLEPDREVVFASDAGTVLDPTNVTHRFQQTREGAGLPALRLHDLRHTAATLMLLRKVHPSVVREMLGHSSILVTLDTYSHVIPTMQEGAAREMNELFQPNDHELE